jgi:hypothetical protein
MGAAVSLESTLTTVVLVGAVGVGYTISSSSDAAGSSATKPKKKKKKGPEDRSSIPSPSQSTPLVNSSSTIPGQFQDPPLAPSRPKKPKKKQTQKQTSELALAASAVKQSTTPANADESWTRVEARRRVGRGSEQTSIDVTTTDAGLTSSVTENSSPVDQEESTEKLTTLAERLVLKPPRTGVDELSVAPTYSILSFRLTRFWDSQHVATTADSVSSDANPTFTRRKASTGLLVG